MVVRIYVQVYKERVVQKRKGRRMATTEANGVAVEGGGEMEVVLEFT